MEDLIRRADAIKALGERPLNWTDTPEEIQAENDWDMHKTAIEAIPAIKPSDIYDCDEWCHDCKEYDQENHCCPRWNRVIRMTLKENKTYADGYHDGQMDERNTPTVDAVEVVRCRDCEHWGKIIYLNGFGCTLHEMGMLPSGYCSYGERKE